MALVRHWIPSPNKSGRSGGPRLLVIHTTEGFTGANGMYDCGYYFQGPVGASSHVVVDNFHPGHIVECVSPSYASWTQCNFNSATASSNEQCGYASWPRDVWLNDKEPLLRNTAAWLAEESQRWGIPLTDLSSSQAQSGGRGVCYHSDLGSAGCGHSDPGSGYPLDIVLQWARGEQAQPPVEAPPVVEEMEDDVYALPPKEVSALSLEISLNGMHKNMGICSDATTYSDSTHVRAAFHTGQGAWEVIDVWSDNGHEKVVVATKKPFDAVRLDRIDNNPCVIVPNFGK